MLYLYPASVHVKLLYFFEKYGSRRGADVATANVSTTDGVAIDTTVEDGDIPVPSTSRF